MRANIKTVEQAIRHSEALTYSGKIVTDVFRHENTWGLRVEGEEFGDVKSIAIPQKNRAALTAKAQAIIDRHTAIKPMADDMTADEIEVHNRESAAREAEAEAEVDDTIISTLKELAAVTPEIHAKLTPATDEQIAKIAKLMAQREISSVEEIHIPQDDGRRFLDAGGAIQITNGLSK